MPRTSSLSCPRVVSLSLLLETEPLIELLDANENGRLAGHALLTQAGEAYVLRILRRINVGDKHPPSSEPSHEARDLPHWDARQRKLWLGDALLKEFRQPAPNQITLLAVFEEEGWLETHIDDPLPPHKGEHETDGKRRLHETIKNLNRGLPPGTIRFRGDGTGQGVAWIYDQEPLLANRRSSTPCPSQHDDSHQQRLSYPKVTLWNTSVTS